MKNIPARTYTRPIKEVAGCNLNPVELPVELENACRLCLENTDVMTEIFEEDSVVPTYVKIRTLLFIEIDEEDQLPTVVCARCLNQLNDFYSFKKRCKASDVKLRQLSHRWQPKASARYYAKDDICMIDETEDNLPSLTVSRSECTIDWDNQVPLAALMEVGSDRVVVKEQFELNSCPSNKRKIGQSFFEEDISHEEDVVSIVIDDDQLRPVLKNTEWGKTDKPRLFETVTEDIVADSSNNREGYQIDNVFTNIAEKVKKVLTAECEIFTKKPAAEPKAVTIDEDDIPLEKRLANSTKRSHKTRLKCVRCKNKFSNHDEYLAHRVGCLRGFKCDKCPKEFKTSSMLMRHRRVHTGERPFVCALCNRGFSQNEILQRHIANLHEPNKPYKCDFCQKKFALLSLLKSHLNDSHSDKRHKCKECFKDFQHASGLSRHRAIHTGTRYVCQNCKQIFTDLSSARRHAKHKKHLPEIMINVNKNESATGNNDPSEIDAAEDISLTEISTNNPATAKKPSKSVVTDATSNRATKNKSTGLKIFEIHYSGCPATGNSAKTGNRT